MSRRATLPGADELFRRTSEAVEAPAPGATATAVAPEPEAPVASRPAEEATAAEPAAATEPVRSRPTPRRRSRGGDRRPTGRERHDEKITVYVSPEELVDIEQAKLALRAQHGLAVDRGRIVREAVAVVIADLEAKGEESILVRRLRGV
ncbi:MAG: hypothetical protein GC157_01665 [Frankiales bacterium]|nr:hypothetical protein [Frankiales bacterium]